MKKIMLILISVVMIFTACGSASGNSPEPEEEKIYTFFNHNIYWGISQNEADEILSQKYRTINSGQTIKYTLSASEDFFKPDDLFAIPTDIKLEFEDDKLVKISQDYHYGTLLPSNFGSLFNTYLFIALGADDENELHEHYSEKLQTLMAQWSKYELENEEITLFVNYGIDTTDVSIDFELKESSDA